MLFRYTAGPFAHLYGAPLLDGHVLVTALIVQDTAVNLEPVACEETVRMPVPPCESDATAAQSVRRGRFVFFTRDRPASRPQQAMKLVNILRRIRGLCCMPRKSSDSHCAAAGFTVLDSSGCVVGRRACIPGATLI
ncbi:hypothetical protein B2J88_51550 [Rhodococcus sp. SRB_17]|nr:hypothetical protein [Rhodococcus sp. SRB_17]